MPSIGSSRRSRINCRTRPGDKFIGGIRSHSYPKWGRNSFTSLGDSLMTNNQIRNFVCFPLVTTAAILLGCPLAHAAIEPRSILKTYFETGDVPTQEQFSDLI